MPSTHFTWLREHINARTMPAVEDRSWLPTDGLKDLQCATRLPGDVGLYKRCCIAGNLPVCQALMALLGDAVFTR